MTNEQLAILIRNYALRVDELIKKLNDEIPDSAEQHMEWVKNDGSPARDLFEAFSIELIEAKTTGKSDTLIQVPNGEFVCLDGLRDFKDELWTQVGELKR